MDAEQALRVSRVIWAAMVLGVTLLGCVVIFVINSDDAGEAASFPPVVHALPWVIWLTGAPLGMYLRGQSFKRGWVGDVVEPAAYLRGNLLAWAMCEGAAFAGLVLCLAERRLGWGLAAAAGALATLILLWPNGRALRPPMSTLR